MRGLKLVGPPPFAIIFWSHPTWVRGLKLDLYQVFYNAKTSHPTWVRGLKPSYVANKLLYYNVAPYVGAWIETTEAVLLSFSSSSRTLRGCVD